MSLSEIGVLRGQYGLPVERDLHFKADKTMLEYSQEVRAAQRIVA